jgi:hypothetical protein
MNETYLAAVPAIGFVQVWFSPAQARFAENTFDVVPSHATVEAAHTFSEDTAEAVGCSS